MTKAPLVRGFVVRGDESRPAVAQLRCDSRSNNGAEFEERNQDVRDRRAIREGLDLRLQTAGGTPCKLVSRDARGRQSSRGGFRTRAAARKERVRLVGRVHRGELRISRESLTAYWQRDLTKRRPCARWSAPQQRAHAPRS